MAESTSDFIKRQDKEIAEENPWLGNFNYDETVTPEKINKLIDKIPHKPNPKRAFEAIKANINSKLNTPKVATSSEQDFSDTLSVSTIETTSKEENIEKDDLSKD